MGCQIKQLPGLSDGGIAILSVHKNKCSYLLMGMFKAGGAYASIYTSGIIISSRSSIMIEMKSSKLPDS